MDGVDLGEFGLDGGDGGGGDEVGLSGEVKDAGFVSELEDLGVFEGGGDIGDLEEVVDASGIGEAGEEAGVSGDEDEGGEVALVDGADGVVAVEEFGDLGDGGLDGVAPLDGGGRAGVIGMLAVCWAVLWFVFRDQATQLEVEPSETESPHGATAAIVMITAGITIAGWVTTSLHGYSSGTVAMIPLLVFFTMNVLDVRDLRSLSWDVLLLMGGGLCLGTAIATSGLAEWLIALLPVQGVSVYWLMVIFGTVACLMSSVMSNTATANLIMPIMMGLSVEPLSPLLIGTAFACTLAMPLPVSTPPNAMAFSTDQLAVSDLVMPGILVTIAGITLAFTTGYGWWDFVGLF